MRELLRAEARSVVEVGPGQGGLSWYLAAEREYLGFEPDADAFRVAEERLRERPTARIHNEPIPDQPTDLLDSLVALEVLEHIDADRTALKAWTRWVRPGGAVILSVPAKQGRYGAYDREVGHFRRYERNQLMGIMSDAGLSDIRIYSIGMPLGYLLEYVRNRYLAKRLNPMRDVEARTLRSGRSYQPMTHPYLLAWATWPFRVLQRPFENTEIGCGWVATGRIA